MCVFENEGGIIGAEGKRRRDRHVKRAHTHRDLDFFACRTKQRFIQNKEGREKKKKGMKKKKKIRKLIDRYIFIVFGDRLRKTFDKENSDRGMEKLLGLPT